MDIKEVYFRAAAFAEEVVKNISSDKWENPTPCSEWNVKQLLNHVTYENLWIPELLAGKTVEEVGEAFEGDLLGDNPKRAYEQSNEEAVSAVRDLESIDKTVHLSFGDFPASEYLNQLIMDKLIHGWDLAKGSGQETALDSELVQYVWDYASPREEELRSSGVFGEKVEVSKEAPLQTKLLAILGRRA